MALATLRGAELVFHGPRVAWPRVFTHKTGGDKPVSNVEQSGDAAPGNRVRVGVGYATLTIAQLVFMAYTAGVLTERLAQVGKVLEAYMQQQQAEKLPSRVTMLEAQMLSERQENAAFRQEVRAYIGEHSK